jgi:mannose-1-phosphate guanylyltransferase
MHTMASFTHEQVLHCKDSKTMDAISNRKAGRWGIVLAGGDGTRLLPLTRRIAGDDRPKQFCPLLGGKTLLEQTLQRVTLSLAPERTLIVATRSHERFFPPFLNDMPAPQLVVQPQNQGTASAILYSLLRLAAMAPQDAVAIFPSDHYVADDAAFMSHVNAAFKAVPAHPNMVMLLGISPEHPEVQYGWIQPGCPFHIQGSCVLHRVRQFWEKPSRVLAEKLMHAGCLWNSFVMVARAQTLLHLIRRGASTLYNAFRGVRPVVGTPAEAQALRALYHHLPATNFSHQVLATQPARLAVLPVRGVEWSDLGEPSRVFASLARMGVSEPWGEPALVR